jgi:glycosyltransferase involved in cell wall biosynthesis
MKSILKRKAGLSEKYKHGKSVMSNSKVSICSIVRDCGNEIAANIPRIERLRKLFKDSEVIIFENDSKDNTREVLNKWKENSSNIHVFSDNYGGKTIPSKQQVNGNPNFSAHRIDKMAGYRNKYLRFLNTRGIDRDYVIVIDLDISRFEIDGIIHSFGTFRHWDCITANGKSFSSKLTIQYHDSYALVECGKIDHPQTEETIYSNQKKFAFMKKGGPLIMVDSAFGGLAIYKWSSIKGFYYSGLPNKDRSVQTKCEHVSLHRQMIDRGNSRIFINPSMTLKYREITIRLILKKINEFFQDKGIRTPSGKIIASVEPKTAAVQEEMALKDNIST